MTLMILRTGHRLLLIRVMPIWLTDPEGPYSQGSPGTTAVGDITGNGLNDIVVAGDGRGATYYYEAVEADETCSLKFKRAALYDDPASMPAEVKLYDIDGDGELEILGTVYDTSFAKDSSAASVFIWKHISEAECPEIADFDEDGNCLLSKEELKAYRDAHKIRHKAEKAALKVSQQDEKDYLKSLNGLLSKEELKLLKNDLKAKHKTEKDALKVSQSEDKETYKRLKDEYAE